MKVLRYGLVFIATLAVFGGWKTDLQGCAAQNASNRVGGLVTASPKWRQRWLIGVRGLDATRREYNVQIAYISGLVEKAGIGYDYVCDIYLSVFAKEGKTFKLLRCTKLDLFFADVIRLTTIPDPQNPRRVLLLIYFAPRYVWGVLYRLNPKTFRPEKLLDAEHLDTSQYLSHRRIAEWTYARYIFPEYDKDFHTFARRWWIWDKRKQKFVCTRWVVPKRQPSKAFWKRFGYEMSSTPRRAGS